MIYPLAGHRFPSRRRGRPMSRLGPALLGLLLACGASVPARAAADPEELGDRYFEVLRTLAEGHREEALSSLATLETEAIEGRNPSGLVEELWRAKLAVVRDLMQGERREVLVPIMVFHHDAMLEYQRRGQPLLARHSLDMVGELAPFYAEHSTDPSARVIAADLLTSLGGRLQDAWSLGTAARWFDDALRIDPANDAAHVGLGVIYEKRGEYQQALEHLSAVLARSHGNPELRLRAALCRKRLRQREEASRELRALTALSDPPWVVILAYQELAQSLVSDESYDEAEAILMQARERFPDNERLAIQVEFLRQQAGRSSLALQELDAVERPPVPPVSPRYLYTLWPQEWLERVREVLAGAAEDRLALLHQAIAPESTTEAK